jgi:hypothetical protein
VVCHGMSSMDDASAPRLYACYTVPVRRRLGERGLPPGRRAVLWRVLRLQQTYLP